MLPNSKQKLKSKEGPNLRSFRKFLCNRLLNSKISEKSYTLMERNDKTVSRQMILIQVFSHQNMFTNNVAKV